MLTWKQRGSKILATWLLGFGSSVAAITPLQPGIEIQILYAAFGGIITAIPQMARVLSDYSENRK